MFFNGISFKALSTVACLSSRYCRDLIYLGLLTFKDPIQWNSVNQSTVNKSSRLLHPICLERNRPNPFP